MAIALLRVSLTIELPSGLGIEELRGRFVTKYDRNLQRKKQSWKVNSLYTDSKYACVGFDPEGDGNFIIRSSLVVNPAGEVAISSEQKVYDVVLKQAALMREQGRMTVPLEVKPDMVVPGTSYLLKEAYDRCGEVCAEYAKTFYLGTLLMTPERRRAIWAIYGGPTSSSTGPMLLTLHLQL